MIMNQLKMPKAREMYDTVVIDTASIAWDLCEKYICRINDNVRSINDIPYGKGFGMLDKEFQEALREITMLGFGLILICHSKETATGEYDEDGNKIMQVCPNLPTRAYTICNSVCDVIGYINVENFHKDEDGYEVGDRYLYTRQTSTIYAGSRYKYLAPKIPFGYDELNAALDEAIEKDVQLNHVKASDEGNGTPIPVQLMARPFEEVMSEVKELWINYVSAAKDEEDEEYRKATLNDIVTRNFGKPMKLSQALPSQSEIVELVIEEIKRL